MTMTTEQKAKAYDEAIEKKVHKFIDGYTRREISRETLEGIFPELREREYEQNILFEELKALHLRMEHQTVCNDAGGNRMWRRAWQHINEAINIIKEDKETYKW